MRDSQTVYPRPVAPIGTIRSKKKKERFLMRQCYRKKSGIVPTANAFIFMLPQKLEGTIHLDKIT